MTGTLSNPRAVDELGAVNSILSAAGKRGVSSVSESNAAAWSAATLLHDLLVILQMGDYHFNSELDIKLTPNADSEILLPDNILTIKRGSRCTKRIVERGGKLYDLGGSTFKFTDPVYVDMRVSIAFDSCPFEVRNFVRYQAAIAYIEEKEPGSNTIRTLHSKVIRARETFENWDSALSPIPHRMRNPHINRLRGHG